MSGDWRQYFKTNHGSINGKGFTYYEYKDKRVEILPANLPMPPTDIFYRMFYDCQQLQDLTPLANWDVSKVENMRGMFDGDPHMNERGCRYIQDLTPLANWDVSNVKDMSCMFSNCRQLQNMTPLANWDVSKVEDMSYMFYECQQLQDISALANWDVSNVENMGDMFSRCNRLQDITALANWDVSNVKDMSYMISCYHVQDLTPLANWDVSNVKDMNGMFSYCKQLQDLTPLANWDVSNVEDMYDMFYECEKLNIPKYTSSIKCHLRNLPKRSYPKQDHSSLLQSLWERVKPLLKNTTKLNGYFKRYTKSEPIEEPVNVAKPDALLIDELRSIIQQQQQTIDQLQRKIADLSVFQWNP